MHFGYSVRLRTRGPYVEARTSDTEQLHFNMPLTLCPTVSSADKICKQFRPRSGWTFLSQNCLTP